MTRRPSLDISQLPTVVFEARSIMSWAMFGMMMIEGTMFCIVLATYFYLRTRSSDWPPGTNPPALLFGSLNTGILIVSLIPNLWAAKVAKQGNASKARTATWIMALIGLANLVVRVYEFKSLNCH